MDPGDFWLQNEQSPYAGAASGTSVAPVVQQAPVYTPNPSIPIGGGVMPDYAALIKADPSYQSYLASGQQSVAQAAAQRKEQLQRLAIQYGGMPAGMSDKYGDIDAGTLELAGKNQFSDTQRLQTGYAQSVEAFKRALAARGALQSGDLGYGLQQADVGRGQQEYDLGVNFANAATGLVNQYVGVENGVRQGEANALSQAGQNVYSNPANMPSGAYNAPLVAGSVEQYGQALYQGQDGTFYTANGNPFNPQVAAPAPAPAPVVSPFSYAAAPSGDPGALLDQQQYLSGFLSPQTGPSGSVWNKAL